VRQCPFDRLIIFSDFRSETRKTYRAILSEPRIVYPTATSQIQSSPLAGASTTSAQTVSTPQSRDQPSPGPARTTQATAVQEKPSTEPSAQPSTTATSQEPAEPSRTSLPDAQTTVSPAQSLKRTRASSPSEGEVEKVVGNEQQPKKKKQKKKKKQSGGGNQNPQGQSAS
jgi:hypothetical protein